MSNSWIDASQDCKTNVVVLKFCNTRNGFLNRKIHHKYLQIMIFTAWKWRHKLSYQNLTKILSYRNYLTKNEDRNYLTELWANQAKTDCQFDRTRQNSPHSQRRYTQHDNKESRTVLISVNPFINPAWNNNPLSTLTSYNNS